MDKTMHAEQVRMYTALASLAETLKLTGKTMTCDEVLEWIADNFHFDPPYGGVGGIFKAAHKYATPGQIDALESVFTDKDGNPLLDD